MILIFCKNIVNSFNNQTDDEHNLKITVRNYDGFLAFHNSSVKNDLKVRFFYYNFV